MNMTEIRQGRSSAATPTETITISMQCAMAQNPSGKGGGNNAKFYHLGKGGVADVFSERNDKKGSRCGGGNQLRNAGCYHALAEDVLQ